ncbi:MAG: Gfo/Idh/MocA family protein [Planctomycetota bacterium]|jgi:predicted dehydrogenase
MRPHERGLTRRRFLKGAAAAAGAAALPAIVPSSAFGASDRIALAHIGVGGRGGSLLGGFVGLGDCRIVATCDLFKSRREGRAGQVNGRYRSQVCKPYRDFREVLARDDIDAVVIATPDHWHVPIAMAAARAGKDMYVEKPLGVAAEWNFALRETLRRYGIIFQYGTQQRSSRHCRFGCELVRNGRIGKIQRIEVVAPGGRAGGSTTPIPVPADLDYDMWLGPAPWSPYTKDRCTSNGTYFVYDNSLGFIAGWGAHPLDILLWGSDPDNLVPVEFEGTGRIPTDGLFDTITSWDVRCKYANGVEMRFTPGGDSTKWIGEKGWVRVRRGGLSTEPKSLMKSTIGPDEIHLVASRNHGQNFLDAVKTRTPAVSPIESSVDSDTISHLSDIAVRTGRKIRWDPKKEKIIGDEGAARMLNRAMRSPWRL